LSLDVDVSTALISLHSDRVAAESRVENPQRFLETIRCPEHTRDIIILPAIHPRHLLDHLYKLTQYSP
jgi:hypothetical protein